MGLAAKIFMVRENVEADLETLAEKLREFRQEGVWEEGEQSVQLVTEIRDLRLEGGGLYGVFSQDKPITLFRRGERVLASRTMEAPFAFNPYRGRMLLTILAKRRRANDIANQLSRILFIAVGQIVEARITPDVLRRFHEENFDDTKVVFFDDVDVPNVDKLSLYGSALGNTTLYTDYMGHGKLWYIVIRSRKYGYVVGLTRNCVVTIFSRVEEPEFLSYIVDEVFPLISLGEGLPQP